MSLPYAATWDLVYVCNYRCPYCFIDWHNGQLGVMHTAITLEDWCGFWERMSDRYGRFRITLTGGEPFTYPGIIQLLEWVTRRHQVELDTNLSWEPEMLLGRVSPETMRIGASFHPHYTDIETFVSKLTTLQKNHFKVMATVVAYPPLFDRLAGYRTKLEENSIGYFIQPYQGALGGKQYPRDYPEAHKTFLYGESVLEKEVMGHSLKERSPRGRLCAAGQRRFRVSADGNVFRCYPSLALKEAPLGHIKDENLTLWDGPRPCPADGCFCPEEYSYLVDLNINGTLSIETCPGSRSSSV